MSDDFDDEQPGTAVAKSGSAPMKTAAERAIEHYGRAGAVEREATRVEDLRREARTALREVEISGVRFSPRLLIDLAVWKELPPLEVFAKHGLTTDQAIVLLKNEAFAKSLREATAYVADQGLSFRARARAIAEEVLGDAYDIITDPDMPASVRADLIKWSAEMGDLEPAKKKDDAGSGPVTPFALHISFTGVGDPAGQRVIDVTPARPAALEQGDA